jgi:hypothetical protein
MLVHAPLEIPVANLTPAFSTYWKLLITVVYVELDVGVFTPSIPRVSTTLSPRHELFPPANVQLAAVKTRLPQLLNELQGMVFEEHFQVYLCRFPTVEVASETAPKLRVAPAHKVNQQLAL